MLKRTQVVLAMLTAVRQIVTAEAFALDAAELAESLEDPEAAAALRGTVVSRKTKVATMRYIMSDLSEMLARMPLEDRWIDREAVPRYDWDND